MDYIAQGFVPVEDLSGNELLREAADNNTSVWALDVRNLELAAQWAVLHPAESILDVAGIWDHNQYQEDAIRIAGPGCPQIAEFAVAEFGAVLQMSTLAAKKFIGDALELQHRLPKTWARLKTGTAAPWRARIAAQATIHADPELSEEAVEWIDHQIAGHIQKISSARMGRLINAAVLRFKAIENEDDPNPEELLDPHHVDIDTHSECGHPDRGTKTLNLSGALEPVDAFDLEHALQHRAADLKAEGCTRSLRWRRAKALGDIARVYTSDQLAADEPVEEPAEAPSTASGTRRGPVARRLDFNLHLRPLVGPDGIGLDKITTIDEHQLVILTDQIKEWCADSNTEVRILPILDLNEEITANSYTPPPRLRRQVMVRDRQCLFPYCTNESRCCDLDHVHPYSDCEPPAQQTRSSNLTRDCRGHHRLKTHSNWKCEVIAPGTLLWTSPHGHKYLCNARGTTAL